MLRLCGLPGLVRPWRFQGGMGVQRELGGLEPAAASGGNRQAERRESQGVTERHDYASSPRNPNPPSSLWPQRSA